MLHCLGKADDPDQWVEEMEKIVLKNGRGHSMDN